MELERAKGTRDFAPQEQLFRNKIIAQIKQQFELYGFAPLETPILERYDIMTMKDAAGEGSDCVSEIFRVKDQGGRELGLRYEMTFPLARFVAMNSKMKLPFKRYAIGPVFRDGPIKAGRYREFYQCDIDTVGSKSILTDADTIACLASAIEATGIKPIIKISSRKFLSEYLLAIGVPETSLRAAIITIDKLDKLDKKIVIAELVSKGISQTQGTQAITDLTKIGSPESLLQFFEKKLTQKSLAIQELKELFSWLNKLKVRFEFSPSLARGLAYYTGTIFEMFAPESKVTSSIASGGRWDNMIGKYVGKEELQYPAVGGSIGLEPLFDVLREKNPPLPFTTVQCYLIPMDTEQETLGILQQLRLAGICSSMDIMNRNLKKNLEYASGQGIPYAGIIGTNEVKNGVIMLKNMATGEQNTLTVAEVIQLLSTKN